MKESIIILKNSSVEDKVPLPIDLEAGELALNLYKGKENLWVKNSEGDITCLRTPRADLFWGDFFLKFETKAEYEAAVFSGAISDTSIVYIAEGPFIYTGGQLYSYTDEDAIEVVENYVISLPSTLVDITDDMTSEEISNIFGGISGFNSIFDRCNNGIGIAVLAINGTGSTPVQVSTVEIIDVEKTINFNWIDLNTLIETTISVVLPSSNIFKATKLNRTIISREELIAELDKKVDKIEGLGLSELSYTSEDKILVDEIPEIIESLDNKQDNLTPGKSIIIDENNVISIDEEDFLYTNAEPTKIPVGNIKTGTTFENKTMEEMFNLLLYSDQSPKYPTLTDPSFILITEGLPEVIEITGEEITFDLIARFDRGKIDPDYGTDGYRAGLPTEFTFFGPSFKDGGETYIHTPVLETEMIVSVKYIFTEDDLINGVEWSCEVTYLEGDQPLDSQGSEFGEPYPAGQMIAITEKFLIAFPFYATSESVDYTTIQVATSSNESYYEVMMTTETDSTGKQRIELFENIPLVIGIKGVNPLSSEEGKDWQYYGGSAENSLSLFDLSEIIKEGGLKYRVYTYNGKKVGARRMRFYVNEN